jgi:dipeptidase D
MTLLQLSDEISSELVPEDRDCTLCVERAADGTAMLPMDDDATARVLTFLHTVPQGVLRMSHLVPGLVDYSRNVGVITTTADAVHMTLTSRSGRETLLDHAQASLTDLAALCGGSATHRNRYPGWDYAEHSVVRDAYIRAYTDQLGSVPGVFAIHAGLESGYVKKQVPDMDIISVGPDMKNIHSPDEQLFLPSVCRVWQVLLALLRDWS